MMIRPAIALLSVLATAHTAVVAEELRLTATEIANLAIRVEAPVPEDRLSIVDATGTVVVPPGADVLVTTPMAGMIRSLTQFPGESIEGGEVLAELSSAGFIELQRDFLNALNRHRLARTELDRDQQLLSEGIISERRVQEASVRERIAATVYGEHRQLLSIAGMLPAEVDELEQRQLLRETIVIRAPMEGVVTEQMVVVGERVDDMSALYRVADLSKLWLAINVRQQDLVSIRADMTVHAGDRTAVVRSIGRLVDPVTQTSIVRAELDDSHGFSPGQFVAVQIVAESANAPDQRAWRVSASAVTQARGIDFIFVQTPNGFEARDVDVLGSSQGTVRLRATLQVGDRVVVSGVSALKALWAELDTPES